MARTPVVASESNRTADQPNAHGGEAADAFHLVCPSLPGYGFSDKPTRTGWKVQRIAKAWSELMLRSLKRYAAQGGDGAPRSQLASDFRTPQRLGIHVKSAARTGTCWCESILRQRPHRDGKNRRSLVSYYNDWDSGYSKEQSNAAADRWLRPQRLAVGQMAWISRSSGHGPTVGAIRRTS